MTVKDDIFKIAGDMVDYCKPLCRESSKSILVLVGDGEEDRCSVFSVASDLKVLIEMSVTNYIKDEGFRALIDCTVEIAGKLSSNNNK